MLELERYRAISGRWREQKSTMEQSHEMKR